MAKTPAKPREKFEDMDDYVKRKLSTSDNPLAKAARDRHAERVAEGRNKTHKHPLRVPTDSDIQVAWHNAMNLVMKADAQAGRILDEKGTKPLTTRYQNSWLWQNAVFPNLERVVAGTLKPDLAAPTAFRPARTNERKWTTLLSWSERDNPVYLAAEAALGHPPKDLLIMNMLFIYVDEQMKAQGKTVKALSPEEAAVYWAERQAREEARRGKSKTDETGVRAPGEDKTRFGRHLKRTYPEAAPTMTASEARAELEHLKQTVGTPPPEILAQFEAKIRKLEEQEASAATRAWGEFAKRLNMFADD